MSPLSSVLLTALDPQPKVGKTEEEALLEQRVLTLNEAQRGVVMATKQQIIEILRFYMDIRLDARLSRLLDKFKANMKALNPNKRDDTGKRRSSILEYVHARFGSFGALVQHTGALSGISVVMFAATHPAPLQF